MDFPLVARLLVLPPLRLLLLPLIHRCQAAVLLVRLPAVVPVVARLPLLRPVAVVVVVARVVLLLSVVFVVVVVALLPRLRLLGRAPSRPRLRLVGQFARSACLLSPQAATVRLLPGGRPSHSTNPASHPNAAASHASHHCYNRT